METKTEKEHEWLKQFVGEWTYTSEIPAGPGHEGGTYTGTENVRAIGDLWIQAEGKGEMPGGGQATTIMTLGYDPQKKKFVGTWLGSMMAYLWVYEGQLEASGKLLALDTIGPDFSAEGKMANYQERVEFTADGNRLFTSNLIGEDGKRTELVRVVYTRKK